MASGRTAGTRRPSGRQQIQQIDLSGVSPLASGRMPQQGPIKEAGVMKVSPRSAQTLSGVRRQSNTGSVCCQISHGHPTFYGILDGPAGSTKCSCQRATMPTREAANAPASQAFPFSSGSKSEPSAIYKRRSTIQCRAKDAD